MTDRDLLTAVAEGSVEALRSLHERHATWLSVRLGHRCHDRLLVEEVVLDTFVVVWRKAAAYRGEGEVGAWLWGIAVRKLVDRMRRRPIRVWHEPLRQAASAEESVLAGIAFGDLGKAVDQLSPELLAVIQARILDGLSTREAARLLGIPSGTVKSRLMRAKKILREQLA